MKLTKLRVVLLLVVSFLFAILCGYLYDRVKLGNTYSSILNNSNILTSKSIKETDILIIYITDINCESSHNKKIISHINEIVHDAKLFGNSQNYDVKFKVAALNNPYRAIHLLSEFKYVDEVNFGNEWKGITVSRLLLNNGYSEKSTPQLIILERTNVVTNHGVESFYSGFSEEKTLYHLKTMPQILEFDIIKF